MIVHRVDSIEHFHVAYGELCMRIVPRLIAGAFSLERRSVSHIVRLSERMSDPVAPHTTFSCNPLNRVSWLREDADYLRESYARDDALFICLNSLDPLVEQHDDGHASIARVARTAIAPYLPHRPFADATERGVPADIREQDDEPIVVFLGVDEQEEVGSSLPAKGENKPAAPAVFAIDLSTRAEARDAILAVPSPSGRRFASLRTQVDQLSLQDAGLAAEARSLVDWNRRNRFCAGCGRVVVPIWGGWKRSCRSDDCPTSGKVQNYVYPRTDSVIIVALLHPSEDKILLGRQRVWPSGFYSCLAGFVEPAETLEEAVIREMYEEAGIKVRNVRYLRSQPWPFPNSLMCGMMCEAEPGSQIRTDLDNELESALWWDRATVLQALANAKGFSQRQRDHIDRHYGDKQASKLDEGEDAGRLKLRLPPVSAIAHHLIKLWAVGDVSRLNPPHTKM